MSQQTPSLSAPESRVRRSDTLFADTNAFVSDYIGDANIAALEGFKGNPGGAHARPLKTLPKGSFDRENRRWMAGCLACGPDKTHGDMEWLIRRWISLKKAQVLRIDQAHPVLRAWAWMYIPGAWKQ